MIAFMIVPMLAALGISFTKYTILQPPSFIGLSNYIEVFRFRSFWNSLWVTAKYVFIRVIIIMALGLFVSLVLNQKIPLFRTFQSIFFLPYVFPLAVTSVVWKVIFRPYGLMEQVTSLFGVVSIPWLSSSTYALWSILITTIWSGLGYYSILILAGLQSIPEEVIEAAYIDGATWWQRLYQILLPLLRPTLFYVAIVALIGSVHGFAPFLIMTAGGPGESTRVIGLMIYQYGFAQLRMGFASAMSILLLLIILALTLVQMRALRGGGEDN
jgi:ABC-type sugar transport system permease subunit